MVDLFEEVEEELRVEQYKKLALRLAPWVLGGLAAGIVVALGAYGVVRYQSAQAAKAAQTYAAALDQLDKGDTAAGIKQLEAVKGSKGYRTLALMLEAGLKQKDGKDAEAIKLLDQAADAAPKDKTGLILADTARLKAAWAVMDSSPYPEVEKRLKPLTETGRPLRALAQEALNIAMLNAGMTQQARTGAKLLTASPDASEGIVQRANAMVAVIDNGGAKAIPAVSKASLAIQPPAPQQMQITPEMIEQARAQAQAQAQAAGGAGAPPAAPSDGAGK